MGVSSLLEDPHLNTCNFPAIFSKTEKVWTCLSPSIFQTSSNMASLAEWLKKRWLLPGFKPVFPADLSPEKRTLGVGRHRLPLAQSIQKMVPLDRHSRFCCHLPDVNNGNEGLSRTLALSWKQAFRRKQPVSSLIHLSNTSLLTYLAVAHMELSLETTCWILLNFSQFQERVCLKLFQMGSVLVQHAQRPGFTSGHA